MINTILLGIMGGPEIIIIAVLILLLFGGKRIPEMMRGLGKGIKDMKKTTTDNDLIKDIKDISSEIKDVSSGVNDLTNPGNILKKKK
ncbi:MAG: twin-arginine translocase TatA/TatE family subunit [Bacteroidetes bacterium]|nr:twin-arginine translocase TatA/TatE family subunit [Bacteroidota bacterium]|tara:strand:+ start:368 stop:628 length:261 start_codon:yes stop_codon:yes gene_type:complete